MNNITSVRNVRGRFHAQLAGVGMVAESETDAAIPIPDDDNPPVESCLTDPEAENASVGNGAAAPNGIELAEFLRRSTRSRFDLEIDLLLARSPRPSAFEIRDTAELIGISPAAVAAEVKLRQAEDGEWSAGAEVVFRCIAAASAARLMGVAGAYRAREGHYAGRTSGAGEISGCGKHGGDCFNWW
ncbi:MAG: hypothetical protein M3436_11580 [Pseudomonadota bacterium]|nr:hypothetical protein [Pseudomonadota bacterium]